MFILMIIVFVIGYITIAMEHPLKIDKAATALMIGALTWAIYALYSTDILALGHSYNWNSLVNNFVMSPEQSSDLAHHFVKHELAHHLVDISEILFFLLGAMTIVEVVDHNQGFKIITDKITTTNKVKLLWVLSFITFFMSAVLDNLTTTIVMITLLNKIVKDKNSRWLLSSIIIIAANSGGAWSPIGDITTIMLWMGGQVTSGNIISVLFLPSLVSLLVPLIILTFTMEKTIVFKKEQSENESHGYITTRKEQWLMFSVGVLSLLFVPVFKTITHLPPYLGMLLGLSFIWVLSEFLNRKKHPEHQHIMSVSNILRKVDVPTILFFLGILLAVASLQSAGQLNILSKWLDDITNKNIYIIDVVVGLLSSIIDNVPLVAGTMGMYEIANSGAFSSDGIFWELLAYTSGTGGSILIIGSAAGIAAMGMQKIDFIWYFKKISALALIGYLSGVGAYYLQSTIIKEDLTFREVKREIKLEEKTIKILPQSKVKYKTKDYLEIEEKETK